MSRSRSLGAARATLVTLLLAVAFVTVPAPPPAAAAVNYAVHDVYNPTGPWNGRKIYISPGHFLSDPRPFPCGTTGQSEYSVAWHIGYNLRDRLLGLGYIVMMPNRASEVGYTTRIDTAYDWWSTKTNNRFIYVALHSNGHGPGAGCTHSGTTTHGGTQLLMQQSYDNGLDDGVGGQTGQAYNQVARRSPGTAHETRIFDRCTNPGYANTVAEICTTKPREMRTIFMENEFHDTTGGANWLFANEQNIALYISNGIHCYYVGGVYCL